MNRFKLSKIELQKTCTVEKNCQRVFCILHENEYLGTSHPKSHSCIACNLNESLENIYIFLVQNNSNNLEYSFSVYILLSYLLVEKLTTIFKHIGITLEYVEKKWMVLIEIRKWANFVKHPKGFLFSHHPKYFFEDDSIPLKYQKWKKIDYTSCVEPLYKREDEKKYQETIKRFGNKKNLLVIIPNPQRISIELNNVCHEFCEKIKQNEHFKEILRHETVLDPYIIE